jgi:Zn-dependent protease with chaperone function
VTSEERRPLTDAERARLSPLVEETEIPVCVTAEPTVFFETEEWVRTLSGEAVGWRSSTRRVVLSERCFECEEDAPLVGLLAHELGHHDGNHLLLSTCFKWGVAVLGLFVVCSLLVGIVGGILTEHWLLVVGSFVAIGAVPFVLMLGSARVSRWMELDATHRGALLLGETGPLEALYEPRADDEYGPLWAELLYPYPHPTAKLEQLAALDEDLDQDDLDDDR